MEAGFYKTKKNKKPHTTPSNKQTYKPMIFISDFHVREDRD